MNGKHPFLFALALLVPLTLLSGCAGGSLGPPGTWDTHREEQSWDRYTELCKTTARETVYRQVEGVKGFVLDAPAEWWVKGSGIGQWATRQTFPAPSAYTWEIGVEPSVLRWPALPRLKEPAKGPRADNRLPTYGFHYVEVNRNGFERYASDSFGIESKALPLTSPTSRYLVRVRDVTGPAERALWVGSASVQVIDSQTGELLAEQISHVKGFAWAAGNATPGFWGSRTTCPRAQHELVDFIQRALVPAPNPALMNHK